ncbi:MAG: hypothetical protein WC819_01680 [Parcubacteria group bacterium]|jgi:hypothetical protein
MDISDAIKFLSEGDTPPAVMMVATKNGSAEVHLYGINGHGCAIAVEKIEEFLTELAALCVDSKTLYQIKVGEESMDIPGFKLPSIYAYLREARDIGTTLNSYQKYF